VHIIIITVHALMVMTIKTFAYAGITFST